MPIYSASYIVPITGISIPSFPTFPNIGGVAECNAVLLDQDYFLRLYDRTYPLGYLEPLKRNPNSGYELFQAFAAVGARISLAVERFECGSFIIFAPSGSLASGTVRFRRPTGAAGTAVLRAGSIVTTSRGNRNFVLTEDVTFSGAAIGPINGTVRAIAAGYEWNVTGQRITAAGEALPGEIDTIHTPYMAPDYGDPTIYVEQIEDMVGGAPALLDGLGQDRGLARQPGESDGPYRLRVRSLADTVSPGAIRRSVAAYLDPYGIEFDFIETWQNDYQTAYDAPSANSGTPTYQPILPSSPTFNTNLFVYDDPRPEYPLNNVYLDLIEQRGAFIIVVDVQSLYDVGFAFDDTGMQPGDFRNTITGYQRGTPAFDVDNSVDPDLVFPAAFDGYPLTGAAIMLGLWELLREIKAAGIAVIIERRRA